MPGSTPILGLPYPLGDEPVRVNVDIQKLAEAIEIRGIPAGTLSMTVATVPDPGYLFLQGQTVAGVDVLYPELWGKAPAQWKSGTSLVVPDMRQAFVGGYSPGSSTHGTLGVVGSSNTTVIAPGNLPAHQHTIDHDHGAITISGGDHGHSLNGHTHGGTTNDGGRHTHGWDEKVFLYNDEGFDAWRAAGLTGGGIRGAAWQHAPDHTHGFGTGGPTPDPTGGSGAHSHTVDLGNFGGSSGDGPGTSAPLNIAPRNLAVNFQIKAH